MRCSQKQLVHLALRPDICKQTLRHGARHCSRRPKHLTKKPMTDHYTHLSDEALLAEKAKMRKSKLFDALFIGFMAGIILFGFVSWLMSDEKRIGFFIPMLIGAWLIRVFVGKQKAYKPLEDELIKRGLK